MGMEVQMNSIVMTTYNGMPFVKEQVDSIRRQLLPDDEFIISDNGSTDGTAEYINAVAEEDRRVRVIFYNDDRGVIQNISQALNQVQGEIIFLADQDDVWLSNKIEHCVARFSNDPTLLLLQTNASIIDLEGHLTGQDFFEFRDCRPGVLRNYIRNSWQGCNMVFRNKILSLVLPIPNRAPMHDVWIGIITEMVGKADFDSTILAHYRRHENNQSPMRRAPLLQVLRWRFRLAVALFNKRKDVRRFRRER